MTAEKLGAIREKLRQRRREASAAEKEKRAADIAYWWETGGELLFYAEHEHKLFDAFREVLLSLPSKAFERFMEESPTILCCPDKGHAFGMLQPVPHGQQQVKLMYIYIDRDCVCWKRQELLNTVAHEIAHVVLGHVEPGPREHPPKFKTEREADALSVKWGYKRCYTEAMLRKLKK